MPLISIIVPVYNVEQYLRRCLDSILEQTFTDFELILVDDGSTDQCRIICDEYAEYDKRVIVIHKHNEGVSNARNSGIEIASGKYIMFCDSDDSWKQDVLKKLVDINATDAYDSILFNCERIDNGKSIGKSNFEKGLFVFDNEEKKYKYLLEKLMGYKHGHEVWLKMFKNEIIQKYKIRFCTTCNNYAEDYAFVASYTLFSRNVLCIEDVLYNYFVRYDSMMAKSKNVFKFNDMNEAIYDFWNYYVQVFNNLDDLKKFSVLHFLMMYEQYNKVIGSKEYPTLGKEIEKIDRYEWFQKNITNVMRSHRNLKMYYGRHIANQIWLFSNYCRHKKWKRFKYESFIYYNFLLKIWGRN